MKRLFPQGTYYAWSDRAVHRQPIRFDPRTSRTRNGLKSAAAIALGVLGITYLGLRSIKGLSNTSEAACIRAAKVQCHNLEQACEEYKLDLKNYPSNLEALVLPPNGNGEPYLRQLPLDPWRMPYRYEYHPDKPYIFTVSPKGVRIDNRN